jgi:hypothetical protein
MAPMSKRKAQITKNQTRKLRNQDGGGQTIIRENGVNYQGAAVLLINHDEGKEDTIVVFRASKSRIPNRFGLASGRCETEHHNVIEYTVTTELYEESRKSILIDPQVFMLMTIDGKYVDHAPGPIHHGPPDQVTRTYICRGKFSSSIFDVNKKIFDRLIAQNPVLETKFHSYIEKDEMLLVPIASIEAAIVRPPEDKKGISVTVNSRNVYLERGVYDAYIAAKARTL